LTLLKWAALIIQSPASKQCIAVLSHSKATPPCLEKLAGKQSSKRASSINEQTNESKFLKCLTQFFVKLDHQEKY